MIALHRAEMESVQMQMRESVCLRSGGIECRDYLVPNLDYINMNTYAQLLEYLVSPMPSPRYINRTRY